MPTPIVRPPEVTMIALFQFLKAGILMLITFLTLFNPAALLAYPAVVSVLVYVAAHGRNPHGFLIPLYALTVASMGRGLWRLKSWSRYSIMFSSAATVGLLIYSLDIQATAEGVRQSNWLQAFKAPGDIAVGLLVLFDILVVGYLAAYPDVVHAFRKR